MVRKIEEIRTEVGVYALGSAPTKVYKYAAYKNGHYERLVDGDSEAAYNTWCRKYNELTNDAVIVWRNELRADYPQFNDAVFELIYARAYEAGHSAGYDEVANEFDIAAARQFSKNYDRLVDGDSEAAYNTWCRKYNELTKQCN